MMLKFLATYHSLTVLFLEIALIAVRVYHIFLFVEVLYTADPDTVGWLASRKPNCVLPISLTVPDFVHENVPVLRSIV